MLMNDPSSQPQQHEMHLEKTHPSGVEEWYCPMCGRRFLLSWPPAYKKIIIEAGDEYAIHNGGKGGLRMGPPQVSDSEEPVLSDELRAALEEALEDIDFDDL
jgi:hypothetical protein